LGKEYGEVFITQKSRPGRGGHDEKLRAVAAKKTISWEFVIAALKASSSPA